MILIDKTKDLQKIFLTLDGLDYVSVLYLENDENRAKHSLVLPDDISGSQERYNLFEVDTELFSTLPVGYYTYVVRGADGSVIEAGKMKIVDLKVLPEIIAPANVNNILIFK